MATIDSKDIVEAVIQGKYADDQPTQVVQYTNAWGTPTWGVTFRGEDRNKYLYESEYIQAPKIIWTMEQGYKPEFKLEVQE